MNTSVEEDAISITSRPNSPLVLQDTQQSNRKQLAAHLILASILLETAAFYSFEVNLAACLQSNDTFHWTSSHGSTASDIFDGKSYLKLIIEMCQEMSFILSFLIGVNLVSLAIFAFISDAKLSRAKTITIGSIRYNSFP